MNVQIRTRAQQNFYTNAKRRKAVNDDYFSNIDTVNKAWVLGFIEATAKFIPRKNRITIYVSFEDKEILQKIKEEMDIAAEIKEYTNHNGFKIATLSWSSAQQRIDLVRYKKSPPHSLTYLLGLYDGCGCLSKNGKITLFNHPEILFSFDSLKKAYALNSIRLERKYKKFQEYLDDKNHEAATSR